MSVRWTGDADELEHWCRQAIDLRAFAEALGSVPVELWPTFAARLDAALASDAAHEPTRAQLRQGVELTERLTTPAGLLRRQIRLEKRRILAELERV